MTTRRVSLTGAAVLAAALVALVLCPAAAGQRPFKARAEGATAEIAPGVFAFSERGHATHLGRYHAEGVVIVAGFNADGTINALLFSADTAANGDRLDSAGSLVLDPLTNTSVGAAGFTGGTGQFRDATGSIRFTAAGDGATYANAAVGTIDY